MRPLPLIPLLLILSLFGRGAAAQHRDDSRRPRDGQPRAVHPAQVMPSAQMTQPPQSGPREEPRTLRDVWRETTVPQSTPQTPRKIPGQSRLRTPLLEQPRPDVQQSRQDGYRKVFTNVQDGLASGDVRSFSNHMGSQVYINLRGGESGYYSANQAYYVLDNYLKNRKLVNINFSTIGESDARPYATGSAGLVVRGNREIAQVYVSLSQVGERWIITQINIY